MLRGKKNWMIMTVAVFFLAAVANANFNLITNGDMETGDPPTGWVGWNTTAETSTTIVHDGSQALMAYNDTGNILGAAVGNTLYAPITGGAEYTFSLWSIKTASPLGNTLYYQMVFLRADGTTAGLVTGYPEWALDEWVYHEAVFNAPADAATLKSIAIYPYYSGRYGYVDDVSLTTPYLYMGDANRDGIVSAGDYAAIQSGFGDTGGSGIYGDANGDGQVSAGDFAAVQANYTTIYPASSPGVPEPMTLSLLAIGGIALIRRKRRNAILLITMVLVMGGAAFGQAYEIPQGTANIDADLSDWAGATWFDVDQDIYLNPINISNAKMAVKWDTSNIYMAVTYDDADLQLSQECLSWNAQDAIEVYINANNDDAVDPPAANWATAQQYFVGVKGANPIGLSPTPIVPADQWYDLGSANPLPDGGSWPYAVIDVETKVTGNSLIYEMRIPAINNLATGATQTLSAGDTVGVDLYVDDKGASNFGAKAMNLNGGKSADAGLYQDWQLVNELTAVHYTFEETSPGSWDVSVEVTGDATAGLGAYEIWVDGVAPGTVSFTENTLGAMSPSPVGFLPVTQLQDDIGGNFNTGNYQGSGAEAIQGIGKVAVDESGVVLDAHALLGTLTTPEGLTEEDFRAIIVGLLNETGDDYFDARDLVPTLEVVVSGPELLMGDANRDGQVSAGDYASVQSNFGNVGAPNDPLLYGDANLDGQVSAGDYASVQSNFGNVLPTAVPEPMTMSLLGLGGLAMLRRRRRK